MKILTKLLSVLKTHFYVDIDSIALHLLNKTYIFIVWITILVKKILLEVLKTNFS